MNIRNQREALSVALDMELRAVKTYERAGLLVKDPAMTEAVAAILSDEKAHVIRFRQMLGDVSGTVDSSLVSAVAGNALFPGGVMEMQREDAFRSVRDLYLFAIKSEEEAVAFYTACADKCEDKPIGEAFLAVAGEERSHLAALQKALARLDQA